MGGGYSVPTPGGNPGSYHGQEYSKDKQKRMTTRKEMNRTLEQKLFNAPSYS